LSTCSSTLFATDIPQLLKITKKRPGATVDEIDRDAILMRAYGNNTEILIDRNREAQSHALLASRDLAPPLLARFNNGLLYRFIQGRVCTPKDLTREPVWRGIARKLAEWHAMLPIDRVDSAILANGVNGNHENSKTIVPPTGIAARKPNPNIWTVMQKWILALPDKTDAEKKRKILLLVELERSFQELDNTASLGQGGLVFGHCDLLSANVIMLPAHCRTENSGKLEKVAFIDYEYATPCPAAFDIANHFAEWGGYDCDYNMLPTKATRRAFLEEYLQAYNQHAQDKADSSEVDKLFEAIDRQRGMPGLYWGIWALIQATISQIDFDYASYAEVRLGEYWAWRNEVNGSRARAGAEMPLRERRWAQER